MLMLILIKDFIDTIALWSILDILPHTKIEVSN